MNFVEGIDVRLKQRPYEILSLVKTNLISVVQNQPDQKLASLYRLCKYISLYRGLR